MEIAASPERNTGGIIKRTAGILLLVLLASVFCFSAISKIASLDAFEWSFLDLGIRSFAVAAILARLMIGLEFLIAFFLIAHLYLRKFTYPLTIGVVVAFTIYLLLLLAEQGNNGNCGCFGDWVYMKPLPSVFKNLGMIAATVVLWIIYPGTTGATTINNYEAETSPASKFKNLFRLRAAQQQIIAPIVGMVAIIIPFIVYPASLGHEPQKEHKAIDLSSLYADSTGKNNVPHVELRKGKHIIAYMSLTCPHCRKAAYLLQIIHRQHPEIPVYFVLAGSWKYVDDFFKETHSEGVPHVMMGDRTGDFIKMAGASVPAIFWVNDGIIEANSNYNQLDPVVMKDWLKH